MKPRLVAVADRVLLEPATGVEPVTLRLRIARSTN